MIKITNSQLAAFNSETINKLMTSSDRQFPTGDAFRIADFISQIEQKLKIYQTEARKLIERSGGTFGENGQVKFISQDAKKKVDIELMNLNAVEIELTGDSLTQTDQWPKLNIQEAMILRPLLNGNGFKKE